MCDDCRRTVVVTDKAPKAIGPYSVGVQAGHFVFTAGQLGIDPATGDLVPGGVQAETRQALENLTAILAAAGTTIGAVVKTTVFLRDIADFSAMNEVYAIFFAAEPPARSAVQVAALPKGAAVEIEAVAVVPCEQAG
ncbi:MAG: RidA family protein [Anaerolineae bacterium]|nr:RidA family protein [Anaerolineae bacterium]